MRNAFPLLLVVLLSFTLLSPARPGPFAGAAAQGDARQAFGLIYAQRDAAFSRRDVAAATPDFAPGFVFINQKGGRLDAAHYRKVLDDEMHSAQSIFLRTTLQTVTFAPDGNTAATVIAQHMDGRASYRILFAHKTAHFTLDIVKREQWVNAKGVWLLSQVQVTSQRQNVQP